MRALLLALLLLPVAQAVSLEISTPPAQFVPDEPWIGQVTVTIPCTEVVANTAAAVHWDVDAGPYNVSGPRSALIDASACASPTGSYVETFDITVVGDMSIEAEQSMDAVFHAQLDDAGDTRADKTLEFEMQFVDGLRVTAPIQVLQGGPQKQLPYELVLTNDGNARIQVQFAVGEAPEEGVLVVPDPVIVDVGATVTAIATYVTPFANGYNDVDEPLSIIASPATTATRTEGEPQEIQLNAKTKGFYVPGPGILAPLLVAFALARRR